VLREVSDSLDYEQIHNLCCFSEEASLNGRESLNATMLLHFLEQKALISPVSLEYLDLWIQLYAIGQSN